MESQLIEASKQELIGNINKSIELLEKMRSIPETKASVYYQLARLYYSKSRIEDAINAINESVLADPLNKWTFVYQANIYESLGKYFNTANSYEALIKIEPENYTMYDLAALNYCKSEHTEKALEILELAQKKFGPIPKVCLQKSKILFTLNKTQKAIDIIQLSLKEYAQNTDLLEELYHLYTIQSNLVEANKVLSRLHEINSSHRLFKNQAITSNSGSNLERINIELNKVNINLDEVLKLLIPELSNMDSSNSLKLFEIGTRLTNKFPRDPKVWALQGDLYFGMDQFFEAIQAYKNSVELSTVPYSVWENYIISLMNMNHWITLEKELNEVLDYYPNQGFLYYALGLAQFNNNDLQNAFNSIQQFSLMSKNYPARLLEADILTAKILDAQGKDNLSEDLWNKCLEADRNDVAIIEYCLFRAKKGKSFPTDKLLKINQSNKLQNTYLLAKNAAINYYLKDYNKAQKFIEESLRSSSGQNPENFELASWIYAEIGDQLSSKNMLIKALEKSDNKTYFSNLLNKLN
ncbi:MAG: hypothetical protein ABI851_09375 [Saprospiraceae bacterium]